MSAEQVEHWAEHTLHPAARRIVWAMIRRHPRALRSYAAEGSLVLPRFPLRALRGPAILAAVRAAGADDMTVRADLHELPELLDRIDCWLAEGVLGGEPPTAADLSIAASLNLLLSLGDVEPIVRGRPCEALARRLCRNAPGGVPSRVAPDYWLPALGVA
jgi:glutathione S-transferase